MKISQQDVQEFIFHEAALIDDGKLEDWLNLFTEDSLYWIPCNEEDYDPNLKLSIVYETKEHLTDRINRLGSGFAYGQMPASKVLHVIGNVSILKQEDNVVIVRSHALISELRRGVMTHYPAKCEHHLILDEGNFKIKFKKTTLLNLDEPLGNLSFIL